jgi:hypothetical protein
VSIPVVADADVLFIAAFQRFRLDITVQPKPEVLLKRLEQDGLVKTAKRLMALLQLQKNEDSE